VHIGVYASNEVGAKLRIHQGQRLLIFTIFFTTDVTIFLELHLVVNLIGVQRLFYQLLMALQVVSVARNLPIETAAVSLQTEKVLHFF
jgi:hypothetical protein